MSKMLEPVTKVVKKNSSNINLFMVALIVLFLQPFDFSLKTQLKEKASELMENKYVMLAVTVLLVSVYFSGDIKMLALLLFVINHLKN